MELCFGVYISEKKAYLHKFCILHESSTFLLVPMVPSISVNSTFGALRPKSGCLSEKSGFFSFSEQSGANLASS